MTLIPVLPNLATPVFVGSFIPTEDGPAPSWDYTSIPITAGDLLIAIIATGSAPTGPAGFTPLVESTGAYNVGVYTKVATGTETTLANGDTTSQVATIAVRAADPGAATFESDVIDPPAIANAVGAMVFIVGADDGMDVSVSAPPAYNLLGASFNTNDTSGSQNTIRFAYRPYAAANENPGPWVDWTPTTSVCATFSVKGA